MQKRSCGAPGALAFLLFCFLPFSFCIYHSAPAMIKIEKTADAVLLPVHVAPGASRARILGEHDGRLKVAVSAAPQRGKANQAVLKLLVKALKLKKAQLSIVGPTTSHRKTVQVQGLTAKQLTAKLDAIVSPTQGAPNRKEPRR